jgi:hypothetical protein
MSSCCGEMETSEDIGRLFENRKMKSLQSPAVGMTPLQFAGLRHFPVAAPVRLHQVPATRKRHRDSCASELSMA